MKENLEEQIKQKNALVLYPPTLPISGKTYLVFNEGKYFIGIFDVLSLRFYELHEGRKISSLRDSKFWELPVSI